jgi:hypothetical protein
MTEPEQQLQARLAALHLLQQHVRFQVSLMVLITHSQLLQRTVLELLLNPRHQLQLRQPERQAPQQE